jgi:hypothetical protein
VGRLTVLAVGWAAAAYCLSRFSLARQAGHQPTSAAVLGQIRPIAGFHFKYICEFRNVLHIHRFSFKLPKFIETCRNVQKWQTKFCWIHLGHLYIVGLTKLTFVQ